MHILAVIQHINDRLLHFLIHACIQRINTDHLGKYLLISFPDLRQRPGNDRIAPLIPGDVRIRNLPCSAVIRKRQLLLLVA